MTIYELFLKSLDIYFWVFIVFVCLTTLVMFTDDYQEDRLNAIKRGIYFKGGVNAAIIRWVLFFLSIQLT